MAPRKPAPPKTFQHSVDAPEPCQAAQVAQLVMRRLKVGTWGQVVELATREDIRVLVRLTPEQQALLDRYSFILPFLRVKPTITVAACAACGRYGFTGPGSLPTRCYFTHRCDGKLVRARSTAAAAAKDAA